MMGRALVMITITCFIAASGWPKPARAQGAAPIETQRECERNGGYWVTVSGYCKIGA